MRLLPAKVYTEGHLSNSPHSYQNRGINGLLIVRKILKVQLVIEPLCRLKLAG